MAKPPPPDFLQGEPEPVRGGDAQVDPRDILPQHVADRLLALPGVDGAWIERDEAGVRCVVLHCSVRERSAQLPREVEGLTVKVVGGEPIRALPTEAPAQGRSRSGR